MTRLHSNRIDELVQALERVREEAKQVLTEVTVALERTKRERHATAVVRETPRKARRKTPLRTR